MQYSGQPKVMSDTAGGITGVLITNLGTPEAPTAKALRPYLSQFLSDPRVIERSKWLWWPILHGIVLRVRPATSAKLYKRLWVSEGSPLMINTRNQAEKLKAQFDERLPGKVRVKFGMRYGSPAIEDALAEFQSEGISQVVIVPLYPQYCASTVGSTFDAVSQALTACRWVPQVKFIHSYFERPDYILALKASVESHIKEHGKPDKLLLSYHGMPQQYIDSGDPYYLHCLKTSALLAESLGLSEQDYITCFQSRFGRAKWLTPATDKTLVSLAQAGVHHVAVLCPGFSSDCLETIDEIGEENKEEFMEAGGKTYHYIPALNDNDDHISMLYQLIESNISQ